ncbi:E3 ubiquitin-protein ligase RNF13-like [Montipora capricornis]|uniref:E3 ubiquitin-protein ligase RNF13-like n=1 Tax=Montipora capricornis TaxID=246305 RepID=UPI0035F1E9F1
MKPQRWWILEALLALWSSFQVCYCSLEPNQVCVKHINDSSAAKCHIYLWASFSEVVSYAEMGVVVIADPRKACSQIKPKTSYNNSGYSGDWFVLIDDEGCRDDFKASMAIEGGFQAVIITTNGDLDGFSEESDGEEEDVGTIPVVYVSKDTGIRLEDNTFEKNPKSRIIITALSYRPFDFQFYMIPFAIIVGICFVLMAMFMISRYYRHYLEQRRNRLSPTNLRKIPTKKFKKGDDYYDVCAICLEEYRDGERLRILPCEHAYHCKCVDPWLTEGKRTCPVCKRPVLNERRPRNRACDTDVEAAHSGETNNQADETTPLISSTSPSAGSNSLTV